MSTMERPSLVLCRPRNASPPPTARPGIRLCIVSFEVNGPSRNGGIGTAYTTLAENLAAAGHDVTLLYARGRHSERGRLAQWIAHFRRRGVKLVPLPGSEIPLAGSGLQHLSYLVYQWLSRQEQLGQVFDLVHFHEWLGLGYFSLLAREQGLAFPTTYFCVGLHSPSRWIEEANQQAGENSVQAMDASERRLAELADVVWSPSRYLLDWVIDRGWQIAARTLVHPNPLPLSPRTPALEPQTVRELVFFGRLEVRKGLLLFCDALDRLQTEDLPVGFSVTFLGKPTERNGTMTDAVLKKRAKKWTFPVRLRTRCDHAEGLRYLQGMGRLAVMPSLIENCPLTVLECLGLGVPFLASSVGGIPELVAQECHPANLLTPRADVLTERLRLALREGVAPARPAHEAARVDRVWDEWHRLFLDRACSPSHRPGEDLVSLVRGPTLRIEWLEEQLRAYSGGDEKFLRYRLADALCACLGKVPLLRCLVRLLWRR